MTENSAVTDVLARYIPGFSTYASQQKRRDEDAAVRRYLVGRLQECKRDLQQSLSSLVDAGKYDLVVQGEKLRSSLELVQSKMKAAVEGYSSWFEKTQIDEAKLKQVVDLDNDLVGLIDRIQSAIAAIDKQSPDFGPTKECVDTLQQRFARRSELLSRS